jgi:hypothetical protein
MLAMPDDPGADAPVGAAPPVAQLVAPTDEQIREVWRACTTHTDSGVAFARALLATHPPAVQPPVGYTDPGWVDMKGNGTILKKPAGRWTEPVYGAPAVQPVVPRHTIQELLALYDECGGDWCRIARAVEDRFIAAAPSVALSEQPASNSTKEPTP